MIYSVQRDPILKRLPTVIDRVYDIQYYDTDNLYPQRCDELRNRSFTLKSAVDCIADFIKGQGFEDVNLANIVFNSEGLTGNDVLDFIAQDKSPYAGFALHFKYNPFSYKIMEITPVEWLYVRLGFPDDRGSVCDVKVSPNWEQDSAKMLNPYLNPETFPMFNPDPEVVKAQIQAYGWDQYPGQILYWTPKPGVYPKARFDAVFDDAQAQAEVGVAKVSGIQNKFSAQHIFKYPGAFEDKEKEKKFKEGIAEFMGASGTNSMMVVEDPGGESRQLVESIQMQNTDKMYEFTSKDNRNAVREAMAVPAAILGQLPESGMFNQEQMLESYQYMNVKTQGDRDQLERVFKKIMNYWHQPVSVASFKIRQLQYGATASQTSVTPGQPAGQPQQPGQQPATPTAAAQPRPEINEAMSKLTGTQDAQLQRIIRQYDSGKLTYERALHKIKTTFPLTDEEAKGYLGPDE